MSAQAEALWLRALQAVQTRGLLPEKRSPLTPRELAVEVERRGEGRLLRLVEGWYYPVSYGVSRGALSDEDALHLVVALEGETVPLEDASQSMPPVPEPRSRRRDPSCELCGARVGP